MQRALAGPLCALHYRNLRARQERAREGSPGGRRCSPSPPSTLFAHCIARYRPHASCCVRCGAKVQEAGRPGYHVIGRVGCRVMGGGGGLKCVVSADNCESAAAISRRDENPSACGTCDRNVSRLKTEDRRQDEAGPLSIQLICQICWYWYEFQPSLLQVAPPRQVWRGTRRSCCRSRYARWHCILSLSASICLWVEQVAAP